MHVKDIQLALAQSLEATRKAWKILEVAVLKLQEVDHMNDLAADLERGNELEVMRTQVQALEQSSTPGLDEAEE